MPSHWTGSISCDAFTLLAATDAVGGEWKPHAKPILTTGIFGTILPIKAETIARLEAKHGKQEIKQFLYDFNAAGDIRTLTEKEGRFILGRPSLDSIRSEITATAKQLGISARAWEVRRSLLSKSSDKTTTGLTTALRP
ncbi:MAG: hypothetical protein R8J85_01505 [Mariprofundales bacterium]